MTSSLGVTVVLAIACMWVEEQGFLPTELVGLCFSKCPGVCEVTNTLKTNLCVYCGLIASVACS